MKTTFAASKGVNNPTVLIAQKLAEARQVDRGVLETSYSENGAG